jgi:hypothetical protein
MKRPSWYWRRGCASVAIWAVAAACSDGAMEPRVIDAPGPVCEAETSASDTVSIAGAGDSALAAQTGVVVSGGMSLARPLDVKVEATCDDLPIAWRPVSAVFRFTVTSSGATSGDCVLVEPPVSSEYAGPVRVIDRFAGGKWPAREDRWVLDGAAASDSHQTLACGGRPTEVIAVEACPRGYDLCGASCVETPVDSNDCGACGHVCGAGELCAHGKCGGRLIPAPEGAYVTLLAFEGDDLYTLLGYENGSSQIAVLRGGTEELVPLITPAEGGAITTFTAANGFVYWYEVSSSPGGSAIRRARSDGSEAATLEIVTPNEVPMATAMAVTDEHIYYARDSVERDSIYRLPIEGGVAAEQLVDASEVHGMTVHGDALYYDDGGAIKRLPLSGGAPEVVGSGRSFALDDEYLYFADDDLQRVPIAGGPPSLVAEWFSQSHALGDVRVYGNSVYFSDHEFALYEVAKDGGTPSAFFFNEDPRQHDNSEGLRPFVVSEQAIFYSRRHAIAIMAR